MDLQPHLERVSLRKRERDRILPDVAIDGRMAGVDRNTEHAFRVLIVDRHTMSADLLAAELARDKQCHALVISPPDLLRRLGTSHVDLVVIGAELNHDSTSGFELARRVSSAFPNISIVILLNESTPVAVMDAFRAGARGVFSRQEPVIEFLACIEHVRKGFLWAARRETSVLLDAIRCMPVPHCATADNSLPLTSRELQVVRCAAKGMSNKTIASELGLSEHTVKNYLFKAFEKLGVSNRVELLLYFFAANRHASEPRVADDPDSDFFAERTSA